MVITDSHCHLNAAAFSEDLSDVLTRSAEAGVTRAVVIGTTPEDSAAGLELAARHGHGSPRLFATAGLHPHEAARFNESTAQAIRELCERDDCVAVGETGLDWFKEWSPREAQLASFRWHLALARELDKPVVIHSRDAHEDTARLVAEFPGVRGVMHCFVMGESEMTPYLDAGLHISFSGIVTFPRSEDNRGAARTCPQDRILVETDAPYLAPVPHRGNRNEPAFCHDTLRFLALLRGESESDLAAATGRNAETLFNLRPL